MLEVLNGAGAGELIDVGGDAQQHPPDAIEVDDDVAVVGTICFGAQVDHRRVLAALELLKPGGAVAPPPDVINEALGDQLAAGEFLIATAGGRAMPDSRTRRRQCGIDLAVYVFATSVTRRQVC